MLGPSLALQLERVVGVPGLAGLDRLLGLMVVTRSVVALDVDYNVMDMLLNPCWSLFLNQPLWLSY